MKSPEPRIETVRVKPVDLSAPDFRLADGRVPLIEKFSLQSLRGLGGAWDVPIDVDVPPTAFDRRFGSW
jgi:hypothetical protein